MTRDGGPSRRRDRRRHRRRRPTAPRAPSGRSGVSRGADGGDDALVPGAAAQVAGESIPDRLVAWVRMVAQERGDADDEARRAEPALQTVVVPERDLDG